MSTINVPSLCVHEMWALFPETNGLVMEIRCIWPKGITPGHETKSRCFDSSGYPDVATFRAAVEEYVTHMNQQGFNLYATLNPLRARLGLRHSANDGDVLSRRRLLIDIDRDFGKEHPASDVEIQAARGLADEIKDYLADLKWPPPVRLMSGNGHHLVYPLADLPNTNEATTAIRGLLSMLKAKFSRDGFSVDTSVSNASRVTKLPGTFVRRGLEVENRPYRIARIYE
jgi:hypothetical protein